MQWLSKVYQSPLDSQLLLQEGHGRWETERKSHQLCLCSTKTELDGYHDGCNKPHYI